PAPAPAPAPPPPSAAGSSVGSGAAVAPPAAPPAAAVPDRSGERALTCGNPSTPTSLLNGELGATPNTTLLALYKPRDAADNSARDRLSSLIKDAQGLRASVGAAQLVPVGEGCEWVMPIALAWNNAFGQPRNRSIQVR